MNKISILFIGDVVGKPGIEFLQTWLPSIVQKYKPDVLLANAENSADGKGITKKEAERLFSMGIQVLTGGNHTWDKHGVQDFLKEEKRALRPLNYPRGCHGEGMYVLDTPKGKIAVLNLQGRAFMAAIDCPFRGAEWALARLNKETNVVVVDFHAEATAEKIALAHWLDGKVSAVLGTHTHIQTADERILPNGTAFITDVGMTGPYDSVIGMKKTPAINRFVYQTPQKYEIALDDVHLSGVFMQIDMETGKAKKIERVFFPDFTKEVEDNATA